MTDISSSFKRKVQSIDPATSVRVIVSLNKPLDETAIKDGIQELGGHITGLSPSSKRVFVTIPAGEVVFLETLSDEISRILEDTKVKLP